MKSRPVSSLLWTLTLLLVMTLACSESTVEPETESRPDPVAMTGSVDLPWDEGVLPMESLQLGFAGQTPALSDSGTFAFTAYPDGPGLLIASDGEDSPVLMSVVPRPASGASAAIDARSTALALLFMTPGITVSDPDDAVEVLNTLALTDGFWTLVNQVETALAEDPRALAEEDAYINQALGTVINHYFEAILETAAAADPTLLRPQGEIVIDPSYEKGALRVTYLGNTDFELSNAAGRWSLAVPSVGEPFWVFPSGVLVDWIKAGRPFPASKRRFELPVALDTEETLNVYGIGFHPAADNLWGDLTPEEQDLARQAGVATVMLELVPHALSLVGNAGRVTDELKTAGLTDTSLKIDSKIFKAVGLIMKNTRIIDRVQQYIDAGNMSGMMYFLTKTLLSEMSTNSNFHAAMASLLGEKLVSSAATKALVGFNKVGIFPLLLANSYGSVVKTVLGFGSSRYKTSFTVSNEFSEFGNVTGTVHDKDSGEPIEGATVELLGEQNNPLEPDLTDVTTSSGAYFFENISTGDKQVRASKEGYLSATVDVRVRVNQTVTAPLIELGRPTGSAYGTIKNRILTDHGVTDDTFSTSILLEAREIGGGTRAEFSLPNGDFNVNLPPGTFWLVARHDYYFPDSVQVTVTDGNATAAGRPLVMKPKGLLEGEIKIDMDGNGIFESTVDVSDGFTSIVDPSLTGNVTLMLVGINADLPHYDTITLMFNLSEVDEPDAYTLGGANLLHPGGAPVAAMLVTSRFTCQPLTGGSQPMSFVTVDHSAYPDQAVCDCGVTFRGTVVVDEWGTDLAEAVSGEVFSGELVGYRNCGCICCEDTDGDGQDDDYVAECARARINLQFVGLVGSQPPP